ncbi:hypothetical protein SAMN05443247_11448 [Bradyrhizobium erythrophlei]|jgi:hypothetical protein|nr:hypothetical protein SAMN05443247_11448 [Bradyrhizobium erythrophlei]
MVLCVGAHGGVKVEKPPGPDADRGGLPIGGGHWRVYRLGPNEGRAACMNRGKPGFRAGKQGSGRREKRAESQRTSAMASNAVDPIPARIANAVNNRSSCPMDQG